MDAPTRGAKGSIQCRKLVPRATKVLVMGREESEYLIVPEKEEKSPQATLWREGDTWIQSFWRERWWEH
jgi:hypothetical protein